MAPLSLAMLDTAALTSSVGRPPGSTAGHDGPRLCTPVPAQGAPARGLLPKRPDEWLGLDPPRLASADQTVTEDHWARPTDDIAALVAGVRAQLSTVRGDG